MGVHSNIKTNLAIPIKGICCHGQNGRAPPTRVQTDGLRRLKTILGQINL